MFEENDLSTPFGSLNVAQGPASGPPIVLLHGVTRRWSDWSPLLPALSARWQVHGLDFRGHGKSSRCAGKYRVIDYVEDARAMVQNCPGAAVVYGHSLGAMVALAVAADSQLNVRAAILEDPPFETMGNRIKETSFHAMFLGMQSAMKKSETTADLAKALADIPIGADDAPTRLGDVRDATSLRFSASCLERLDPEVWLPIVAGEWLIGYDTGAFLPKVQCPVLLLQADTAAGGMLTDEDADRMESEIGDCSRIKFQGAGHLLHWMETEKLLRLVLGFLESV